MYSYGSTHTAAQKQDDQHERTFSSYVRIQVVVLKTYLGRWTIGRSGERGSGISVLPARYDDDDDDIKYVPIIYKVTFSTDSSILLKFFEIQCILFLKRNGHWLKLTTAILFPFSNYLQHFMHSQMHMKHFIGHNLNAYSEYMSREIVSLSADFPVSWYISTIWTRALYC